MATCQKFKIYLEDSKDEPKNLTGLIWKIRQLGLHGVADKYEEAEKAGQELEDTVAALDRFCCKTFEEKTSVKFFANKMRTQLLSLILKAIDAINEDSAAKTSLLKAAIELMRTMKAEAEKHRDEAKKLRDSAKKLDGEVENVRKTANQIVKDVIQNVKDKRLRLELEKKQAEMEKKERRPSLAPVRTIWPNILKWILGLSDLKKALTYDELKWANTKIFFRSYMKVGEALGDIRTYLWNEYNFWNEAAGLLKAIEDEAQAKLHFFNMPDSKLDNDGKLVFLDKKQMELLNQCLLALEEGFKTNYYGDVMVTDLDLCR